MPDERNLEPLKPEDGVELYLTDRQSELAAETLDSYRYKLNHFSEWCESEGIDNLNDLSGRGLLKFKQHRGEDLNPVSLKAQLDTLRTFIRFCESIDAVTPDLHTKILSPSPSQGERQRDVLVDSEQADAVLSHLSQFHYAFTLPRAPDGSVALWCPLRYSPRLRRRRLRSGKRTDTR